MGRVDWIPVDVLSDVLVELAMAHTTREEGGEDLRVYHAINPKAVGWEALVPALAERLGNHGSVRVVPWAEWMDNLRGSARGGVTPLSLGQNPALKLLDWFEAETEAAAEGAKWPVLATEETVKMSPTLAGLPPVSQEWMDLWIEQWGIS
jgi:hypothetical protein